MKKQKNYAWNIYSKPCDTCGKPIVIKKQADGRFFAFDPDGKSHSLTCEGTKPCRYCGKPVFFRENSEGKIKPYEKLTIQGVEELVPHLGLCPVFHEKKLEERKEAAAKERAKAPATLLDDSDIDAIFKRHGAEV